MAFIVGELGATINADRKPFDRTLDSVFRDGGRRMRSLGQNMTAALTLPLVGAGALAVKTAADYETLQVQINTLSGSAEEGAKIFKRLQDFSAGTPFQLTDLTKANNLLMGMGQTSEDAFDNLQILGDVASATGSNINELALTFGQASAEGKLMSRDIREFINRGVPLTKLLADSMGVAQDQIFDLSSQGEISFEVVRKALEEATTGTGIYTNATEEAADTINGVLSTLRDNASRLLADIGDSLVGTFDLKGLVRGLTTDIQQGIQAFNDMSDETKRMAFTVAGLLGAGGPVLIAVGTLSAAMATLSGPVIAATAAVGLAATTIIQNWSSVESYFTTGGGKTMWTDLEATVEEATAAMTKLWESFGDDLTEIAESSMGKVLETIENVVWATSLLAKAANLTVGAFQDVGTAFAAVFGDGKERIVDSTQSMRDLLQASKNLFDFIGADFTQDAKEFAKEMDRVAKSVVRVRVAANAPTDKIIDPADIANTRVMREEFQKFNDALYFASIFTMDFSHRMSVAGEESEQAGQKSARAMMGLSSSLGSVFDAAISKTNDLQSAVSSLLKRLASRAFVTGLGALLTGGTSLGASSFLGAVFGGFRSNGGPVDSGRSFVVGENGREVFTPGTSGNITPVSTGSVGLSKQDVESAFMSALNAKLAVLGPEQIYYMSQQGRSNF